MVVDRAWVARNLGFDPIITPPVSTFAVAGAATKTPSDEDLRREIIDFDSESPAGLAFLAFTTTTGLSRFTDIPWFKGLAPKTGPTPSGSSSSPLPRADVLVVTWTVDEGHALSRVLTPGKDSSNDYRSYTHNYCTIVKKIRSGSPPLTAKRLGAHWTTAIGKKKVVVFKSDSHLSQDTRKPLKGSETLPNEDVWKQIITEVQPKLVIIAGAAGGIGNDYEMGDVIVSRTVRFDCLKWVKGEPFHNPDYKDGAPNTKFLTTKALQSERRAASEGQHPPAAGCAEREHNFVSSDDGLLWFRHLGRSLRSAGTRCCFDNGRRGPWPGWQQDGRAVPVLDRRAKRLGSADQRHRNAKNSKLRWRPRFTRVSAAGVRCVARSCAGP